LKVFRIRFIFDFKIVLIYNFLKMAPVRMLQEKDFLESNLITTDHVGKKWFSVELMAPAWF
jgi:hypothetical protein